MGAFFLVTGLYATLAALSPFGLVAFVRPLAHDAKDATKIRRDMLKRIDFKNDFMTAF
ncbi:MAG: hypothetical protein Q8S18_11290 [Bacteroidales bacterium]|nr:hypothetical protein [Bacteroidales bacterium]